MIEDLSLLYDGYYRHVCEFQAINDYMPELQSGLDGWLSLVNPIYAKEGYIYIIPNINYMREYFDAKEYIYKLVLEINYNYDQMRYLSDKIGNKCCEIKLINPYFEGEEYNECIENLNKLINKESSPINKTVISFKL